MEREKQKKRDFVASTWNKNSQIRANYIYT